MNIDELDDLQASEFVTDNEDQDSLDERIDTEQRLRNQQLWTSFQNAACCITKLYKDRAQPNVSPWVPFQHAASNLTTLYKDCIESQRRFARIGYQAGRRKKCREIQRMLRKQQRSSPSKQLQPQIHPTSSFSASTANVSSDDFSQSQLPNNVASILAVNQINLDCEEAPMQAQDSMHFGQHQQQQSSLHRQPSQNQFQQQHNQLTQSPQQQQQQQNNNLQILLSNNDDDLLTFQSALAQPTSIRGIKSSQARKTNTNSGYAAGRPAPVNHANEDEQRLELNQFLTEEYQRHVGSKKRSCSSQGGGYIKRLRE